ncbi:hypothetical protein C4552_03820 [Candidatus Parcubacteria bacterium]|nr:MAG: hypothetical protein C4552_03820 [Candidatus Parcubacteria bacterium]
MTVTIINDCRDPNALGRQSIRASALLQSPISCIGVDSDLEASGNLIDAIDALDGNEGVILVNVAPRNGVAKRRPNGSPFGYAWNGNVLVLATLDGFTLSLVKKFDIRSPLHEFDVERASREVTGSANAAAFIAESQFRSFDFLPRMAAYLLRHKHAAGTPLSWEAIPDAPHAVWWVDNFGNCKTTITSDELALMPGASLSTRHGPLAFIPALRNVPDNKTALITGSSGLGRKRFLEIVMQGGNAARHLNIASGDTLW